MPRGGYHPHAERWGRKSAWLNASVTKTIRVPEALAERVLDIAHRLDEGETIDCDTKTNEQVSKLEALAAQQSLIQPPDYEAIRDRALAKLKLGKQAPEYKRSKKAMDLMIAELKTAAEWVKDE